MQQIDTPRGLMLRISVVAVVAVAGLGGMLVFSEAWIGIPTLIVLAGFCGMFFFISWWFRVVLWLLSVPPLLAGLLALQQGGIVEPFPPRDMAIFCSFAFWPIVGCAIGEVRRRYRGLYTRQQSPAFPVPADRDREADAAGR